MKTEFDHNAFEHDYIISLLELFLVDLRTDKGQAAVVDIYASHITAFMMGQVAAQLKARPQQTITPSASIEDVLKQLITEAGYDEVSGLLTLLSPAFHQESI